MKSFNIYLLSLFLSIFAHSQSNTVGTIINTENSLDGYILFSPRTSLTPRYTYLMNNCGEVVNQWESSFPLFSTDYLMPDGSLYRSVVDNQSTLNIPGNTGRIEHLDWDNNMLWSLTYSDTDYSFHHDYIPLDNGNIIMLVAHRKTQQEALDNGRDPNLMATDELYEERIIEIEPTGTNGFNIVWEWRSWDHLIQDFDNTKLNFGVVGDHPELVDINFGTNVNEADWWHANSLSYSPELDQIIISNRNLNEFLIIDHSTTTAEAATSSGGNSGMGGDIIYRWGNPESYDKGDANDRKLFGQHNIQFIPSGMPNAGKILIFNNGNTLGYTRIQIIDPPFDSNTNTYIYNNQAYGPDLPDWEYTDPVDPTNFFAAFLSGVQQLPNGNFLICNGPQGTLFEVNNAGETVWRYQSPVGSNDLLSDGQNPQDFETRIFRALKYPSNYSGLDGRDLTPQGAIELNPVNDNCSLSLTDLNLNNQVKIYPTLVNDHITIKTDLDNITYEIFDINGKLILTDSNKRTIDLTAIKTGLYFININNTVSSQIFKFIKK